jgi:hypothetical protein
MWPRSPLSRDASDHEFKTRSNLHQNSHRQAAAAFCLLMRKIIVSIIAARADPVVPWKRGRATCDLHNRHQGFFVGGFGGW